MEPRRRCPRSLLAVLLAAAAAWSSAPGPARASVHDIHLHTDSTPDYASLEALAQTITSAWDDPEDQAIAIWRWITRSRQQLDPSFEDRATVLDPIQYLPSYPNTNCGPSSTYLTTIAAALGPPWRHRFVELIDHTVAELSWDDGATWHMFDTSMIVYARNHDGTIASAEQIASAQSCALSAFWGDPDAEPGHLYVYHVTPESMTNPSAPGQQGDLGYPSGYRPAADNPVAYARTLRNGSDSYLHGLDIQEDFVHTRPGWTNRLHLRPGHVYTRYWDALGTGAEYARLDFRDLDPVNGDYGTNTIRGNGRWEIAPSFAAAAVAGGWHELANIVHVADDVGGGPTLRPATSAPAALVVKVDAANVLTSAAVTWAGTRGAGDQVRLEVSRDAGCTWTTVATPGAGAFAGTVTLGANLIGGAHAILVRVALVPDASRADCGLDELRLAAVTEVNALALPRLQRGPNRARFSAGPARETLTLRPSPHAPSDHTWSQSVVDASGLFSRDDPVGYSSAILVPAAAGVPGHATWRFDTPSDITGANFGGTFLTRFATPDDRVELAYSWDGTNFTTAGVFDAATAPTWNATLFAGTGTPPAGQRSVWLRYVVASSVAPSTSSTGIQDALLEVHHAAAAPAFAPVEVTWCWTEHRTGGDVTRRHTRIVAGPEETWTINVAGYRDPTMEWIRVKLADETSVAGYDDGQNVGAGDGYDKIAIAADWLDDVALERPYTVSRPASGANPDAGGAELTDGVVIPPTPLATAGAVQGQVALWDGDAPVTVDIDLGGVRTVAAVRVTTHQPNATWGHAGTIAVTALGGPGGAATLGTIQHDDVWSPPGPFLDWGYGRGENFTDLPAGDRLAHGFWLVPDAPVTADAVRLDFVPLAGHGLGISEIQVFSAVTVGPWPDREIDLGLTEVAAAPDEGATRVPRRPALAIAPNPANPGTHVGYTLTAATHVRLRIVDLRGRVVRELVDGVRPAGGHRAFWDGRDGRGHAVASGVYLAVGEWGGQQAIGPITLVK